MARPVFVYAMGDFGKPCLWPASDVVRDMDVAAFAAVSRDAAGHEGRGGHIFSAGHQSVCGARLALFAGFGRRSGLLVLCGGGLQRSQSLVDCDAGCDGYLTRMSYLLRQGKPANDIAVLLPEEDAQARFRSRARCLSPIEMRMLLGPDLVAGDSGCGLQLRLHRFGGDRQAGDSLSGAGDSECRAVAAWRRIERIEEYARGGGNGDRGEEPCPRARRG